MENWQKISLILCIYGVVKEFRPSEPFVTKYLNSPPMNFTEEQIAVSIFPVSIYSSMVLLVFVFLITDFLRYKPIIIVNSISGIIFSFMLIVCRNLFLIQIMEIFYGLFIASEIAYYTYIYAKVDKKHYQEVSSHTRGAYLVGRALSGMTSQILVSFQFASYYTLNFFTLAGMIMSLTWAVMLPSVSSSIYFNVPSRSTVGVHHETDLNQPVSVSTEQIIHYPVASESKVNNIKKGFQLLWIDFTTAFSNLYIVRWAVWWAVATSGYYQMVYYVQLLWEDIVLHQDAEYYTKLNGAVEAAHTLLSALGAFLFGKMKLDWTVYGDFVLCICSTIIAIIVLIMARTSSIWTAYLAYIIQSIVYNCMITISTSEVAKNVRPDSYGLIFGFTTFVSLIVQSLLTVFVVEMFGLTTRTQFEIYGWYFCVLGLVYAVINLVSFIRGHFNQDHPSNSSD